MPMRREYLTFMCCPNCQSDLTLEGESKETSRVQKGTIKCLNEKCGQIYPIVNFVPRFVNGGYYANSFGRQWRTFAKTQLDEGATKESKLRWDSEITWDRKDVSGKTIIEFGSGAGRFIDICSKLGAKLAIGIDITDAVDASQENLGDRENIFFIQADIFKPPIKASTIDLGYSIGVLHHTPNPQKAFSKLVRLVNDSGSIALSLYDISLYRRPNRNSLKILTMDLLWALNLWRAELFRTFTTRLPAGVFLAYCRTVVPILHYLNRIPFIGKVRYLFPCTCYKNLPVDWSMLDTYDTYVTKIVHQYRAKDIFQWFLKEQLWNIVVTNSRAGWVSVVANKRSDTSFQHEKYIYEQPFAPGIKSGPD